MEAIIFIPLTSLFLCRYSLGRYVTIRLYGKVYQKVTTLQNFKKYLRQLKTRVL